MANNALVTVPKKTVMWLFRQLCPPWICNEIDFLEISRPGVEPMAPPLERVAFNWKYPASLFALKSLISDSEKRFR